MYPFTDGAHVAALVTARPARGVIAIPMWTDVPWQALFIAALRNQCLTWGGQANLLVPWTNDIAENPLFWRLVEAQDPDLVISAPMSWADLQDLTPTRYEETIATHRKNLEKKGFTEEVIGSTVEEWLRDPIPDNPGELGAPVTQQLIERMGLLHWKDDVELAISLARQPASGPCVDVREFWPEGISVEVTKPVCDGSWDERLAVCALVGDISPLIRDELETRPSVVIHEQVIEPGFQAVDFAHRSPRPATGSRYPFALTEVGLQWARIGAFEEPRVTVVAGDDPWDFALFYALRRLTSRAYWVPSTWADEDFALRLVTHAVEMHRTDRARKATVVSYSDPAFAAEVASSLASAADDRLSRWPTGDWNDAFPEDPTRLFSQNTLRPEQSLVMYRGTTGIINTPIPEPRTEDVSSLQWMVDARVRDWAPIQDPALGPLLLRGVDYRSMYARAAQGGVAFRAPHWITTGGVPLEAQVVSPQLWLPSLLGQLRVIAADSGHEVRLSDKGTYAEECATLLGGAEAFIDVLNDHARFAALWELCFGDAPTRTIRGRAFWESSDLKPLVEALNVGSVADAVARGLLHRGLVHRCRRCAAEAWLEMEDLAGPLRCPRCRLGFDVNDPDWFGVNANDPPKWLVRVNEMVWQFLHANGDIPVRAVAKTVPGAPRTPVATCFEVVVARDGEPVVELDFCASRNGRLYIGEAKLQDELGSSVGEEQNRLAKLERAVTILRADAVVLATGAAGWKRATIQRAQARFPGPWPSLIPTSGSRPSPPDAV